MGPAAMNGPTPGMASVPMPASQPSAPPTIPPVVAPVAVPSGAFECFSWPRSRDPRVSGNRTEMSSFENPTVWSSRTIRSACPSVVAMQYTEVFMVLPPLLLSLLSSSSSAASAAGDHELVVDAAVARGQLGSRRHRRSLLLAGDRAAQRDRVLVGVDGHVL